MAASSTKDFQALCNISRGRPRRSEHPMEMPGADLLHRGDKVSLTADEAEALQGKVRPWSEHDKPMPRITARDLSGHRFPDQRQATGLAAGGTPGTVVAITPAGDQPEEHPPAFLDPDGYGMDNDGDAERVQTNVTRTGVDPSADPYAQQDQRSAADRAADKK